MSQSLSFSVYKIRVIHKFLPSLPHEVLWMKRKQFMEKPRGPTEMRSNACHYPFHLMLYGQVIHRSLAVHMGLSMFQRITWKQWKSSVWELSQSAFHWVSILPFSSYMVLNTLLSVCETWFLHLYNGENMYLPFKIVAMLWESNEIHIWAPGHSRHLINNDFITKGALFTPLSGRKGSKRPLIL